MGAVPLQSAHCPSSQQLGHASPCTHRAQGIITSANLREGATYWSNAGLTNLVYCSMTPATSRPRTATSRWILRWAARRVAGCHMSVQAACMRPMTGTGGCAAADYKIRCMAGTHGAAVGWEFSQRTPGVLRPANAAAHLRARRTSSSVSTYTCSRGRWAHAQPSKPSGVLRGRVRR